MKKIWQKRQMGFSLAEALITLLIVCLITLASIPVLTKKRRDITNSEHGKYECTIDTIFEQQSNGTLKPTYRHKERYSQNTDQWTYVDKCRFTPPPKARNFAFTVIGGGGAGGNALSSYTEYINSTSAASGTFAPEITDYYDIDIVSGGGGGASGTYSHKNRYQPMCGGAGGSGARIVGVIYLTKGSTYDWKVGGGGSKVYGEYRSGSKRAGSGGTSYFRDAGNNVNFEVSGGEGGVTHNGGYRKRQWGGGVGSGGAVINARGARGTPVQQAGQAAPGHRAANAPNGNYYRAFTDYGAGRGGFGGCRYNYRGTGISGDTEWRNSSPVGPVFNNGTNNPEDGHPGKLILSMSKKYHGIAGKAANPVTLFVPSIEKAKLEITIGKGGVPSTSNGGSGTAGGSTIVEFKSTVGTGLSQAQRRIVGTGGAGGGRSETISAAERGENSVWTGDGGGKAGVCQPRKDAPETVCEDVPKFQEGGCLEYQCSEAVEANGDISLDYDSYPLYDDLADVVKTPEKEDFEGDVTITGKTEDEIWTLLLTELEAGTVFPSSFSSLTKTSDGCYKVTDGKTYKKGCTAHQQIQVGTEKVCKEVPPGPATCTDAGNGNQYNQEHYGAGGGGGSGSETPDVQSKGGYGANGALIIEW